MTFTWITISFSETCKRSLQWLCLVSELLMRSIFPTYWDSYCFWIRQPIFVGLFHTSDINSNLLEHRMFGPHNRVRWRESQSSTMKKLQYLMPCEQVFDLIKWYLQFHFLILYNFFGSFVSRDKIFTSVLLYIHGELLVGNLPRNIEWTEKPWESSGS